MTFHFNSLAAPLQDRLWKATIKSYKNHLKNLNYVKRNKPSDLAAITSGHSSSGPLYLLVLKHCYLSPLYQRSRHSVRFNHTPALLEMLVTGMYPHPADANKWTTPSPSFKQSQTQPCPSKVAETLLSHRLTCTIEIPTLKRDLL